MGFLGAVGAGLAEMGAATEKMGMAELQALLEEQRAKRLTDYRVKVEGEEEERRFKVGRARAEAEAQDIEKGAAGVLASRRQTEGKRAAMMAPDAPDLAAQDLDVYAPAAPNAGVLARRDYAESKGYFTNTDRLNTRIDKERDDERAAGDRKRAMDLTEAQIKTEAAKQANLKAMVDASGRYAPKPAGQGAANAKARLESKEARDARNRYNSSFELLNELDKKVIDTDGKSLYDKMFNILRAAGEDPDAAATMAIGKVQAARGNGTPEEMKAGYGELRQILRRGVQQRKEGVTENIESKPSSGVLKPGTKDEPKPEQKAEDIGYDPTNEIQYRHVISNISKPSLRAQALAWIESNSLSIGKRAEVKKALGLK